MSGHSGSGTAAGESAVAGRTFLVVWPAAQPAAQPGSLPAPAACSRPFLLHRQPGPPRGVAGAPAGRAHVAALRGRR